ncbi:MAG: hypothetical protein RL180_658 [Pseudomonadota bacterium]
MTPKTPHALDLIAGQYVLGVLSPSARRRLEAKLLQDSALMDAVHQWERLLNPLAHWLPDAPVPDRVWQRINAQLDGQPTHATPTHTPLTTAQPDPQPAGRAANDALWKPWAWLSSAVAAGLAAFIVLQPNTLPQVAPPLQVQAPLRDVAVLNRGDQPAWIVRQQGTQLVLSNLNAAAVPTDRDLELWSIQGSNAPRSLGLVRLQQGQAILSNVATSLMNGDTTLAISLEPKHGSPTGAPTGDVLYVGKVVHRAI